MCERENVHTAGVCMGSCVCPLWMCTHVYECTCECVHVGADVAHMRKCVHVCAQGVAVRFIPSSLVNLESYFARGLHVFLERPLCVRHCGKYWR